MPDMSTLQPTPRPSHRISDAPAVDFERHKSLWCTEPKGIVIRAQNWIFRVPEGRLRRQPDDRAAPFLHRRRALPFRALRFPWYFRCPAAILRLSGVYYAQRCRSRALRLLARMFPADLDSLNRLLRPSRSQDFGIAQVNSWFVVDAARAARARWLLPSAALFLLSESFRNRKVDRQLRTEELEMRRRYMSLWNECVKRMCAPPPRKGDCGSRRCDAELASFAKAVRTDSTKAFSMSIVLEKKSRMRKKMCYTCTKGFSRRYGELRQWFWSLLPAVCGLEDSWAVLLQEMRRDLRASGLA